MKYRQQIVAEKDESSVTRVALKINSKWVEGILLSKDGKILPRPYEVTEGETYIVEVESDIEL